MRYLSILFVLLILTGSAFADMEPGEITPNPTLVNQDGEKVELHSLFNTVTVLHLWKCK